MVTLCEKRTDTSLSAPVFIGWDQREAWPAFVCHASISAREPERQVSYLQQDVLRASGAFWREPDPLASTDFAWTRFLVPYLCGYKGFAIFVDCDFVFNRPLVEMLAKIDPTKAVSVVKHPFMEVRETVKMDGCQQTWYPRKWWSALMVFNCDHPDNKVLTPSLISSPEVRGRDLHAFFWLTERQIGTIDPTWHFLEGYSAPSTKVPAGVHYTRGGPWFDDYRDVGYADIWDYWSNEIKRLARNKHLG